MSLKKATVQLMKDLMSEKRQILVPKKLFHLASEISNVSERPSHYAPDFLYEEASEKTVVLVSGGLDSTVAYWMAMEKKQSVLPLYVNVGQPYITKELKALEGLGIKPLIVDADNESDALQNSNAQWHRRYWGPIIPGRNLAMILTAAEQITSSRRRGNIIFAATNGEIPEHGGDMSRAFLRLVNELLAPEDVRVITPIEDYTKTDLVFWALEKGYEVMLKKTVSCYSSKPGNCGACKACLRKWIAFKNNGLEFQTEMQIDKGCATEIYRYWDNMYFALRDRDFSKYSAKRCIQTLSALKFLFPMKMWGRVHNLFVVGQGGIGIIPGWEGRQIPNNIAEGL